MILAQFPLTLPILYHERMEKCIVVAYDRNRGIGARGDLPWGRALPADLKHFRALTIGKSVIMGRATFESIGQALPQRENIVVTHRTLDAAGITAVDSLARAYRIAQHQPCVIGGASIYEQALADCDVIYATEVDHSFTGIDRYFPSLDDSWHERERQSFPADEANQYAYSFVTYMRA